MSSQLERFDPSTEGGRIAYEHLHRYAICREFVAGQRVLDIACGTGYGTSILGTKAAKVTGIDINAAAINKAKAKFASAEVNFVVGDCYNLPFEDNSFDAVVANEMIEHVEDHHGLLKEAKRVLTKNGVLLVSTPNKPVYNRYKQPNVFHVSEMELDEFRRTLEQHFPNVALIGLRMALLSVSYDLEHKSDRSNLPSAHIYRGKFGGGNPSIESSAMDLRDPEYALAICSALPVELHSHRESLFFSREEDLWLEHEKVMAWASQLHDEDEILRADLSQAQKDLAAGEAIADADQREKLMLHDQVNSLNRAIEGLSQGLEMQKKSVERESTEQWLTLTRVLGRMTETEVSPNVASTVEALFDLNTRLVEQRGRIAELKSIEVRAMDAEARLANVGQELASEVAKSQELALSLASEKTLTSQLSEELAQLKASGDELRKNFDEMGQEFGEAVRQLKDAREELSKSKADNEDLKRSFDEVGQNLSETEHLLNSSHEELATERAKSRQREESYLNEARQAKRFVELHHGVRAQIADASTAIAGRVQTIQSRKTYSWRSRLARRAPIDTKIFDARWVEKQLPEAERVSLSKYLREERFNLIDPHPLFSAREYLLANPDVAAMGVNALQHYVEYGWLEGRIPHPYFQNDWYLARNPDVHAAGNVNPLDHYLRYGWMEGRWPNPIFDPRAYLDKYPDVERAGIEPLTHYVAYGQSEGREPVIGEIGPDWTQLVPPEARGGHVIDYLLTTDPGELGGKVEVELRESGSRNWQLAPLDNYWLPQELRNYIIDSYGQGAVDLYWYLCSVMAAYSAHPEKFAGSAACRLIVDRLKDRSRAQSIHQGGAISATIVVPVFNNILDTLLCLITIIETSRDRSYEIIVADDGSSDATQELLSEIGGVIRLLRQPSNLGFVGNCNSAARDAVGKYIVLLNNDTLVLPGWLDKILEPFERLSGIGLVGSKLLNWNGTLQEAGGIFWNDGSAWNFGRNQDPRSPEFNYLKDVDYCSGAAIAVSSELWRELGGFDEIYSPAYCEDADLAFRVRAAGYRTVLNPASEVVHHEGRSHGRDIGSGVKAYQVINQQKLLERWGETLRRDHYPNAHEVLRARDRSKGKRHVLVIDHYVPQWDQDAGSRTLYQYIRAFIDLGCQVTFWPDNLWRDPHCVPQLQLLGVEVICGPQFRDGFAKFMENRAGLYDLALVSRPHVAHAHLGVLRDAKRLKIAYYGHDLHFRRMEMGRKYGKWHSDEEIAETRRLELGVCRQSDVIFYPDPEEVAWVKKQVGGKRKFLANPVLVYSEEEIARARDHVMNMTEGGQKLLFVGGFAHTPNREGIVWFTRDVWPLVKSRISGATLEIVGSKPPAEVLELQSYDVSVLGFVSDERLANLYDETAVAVAPLRYGAGVKGKVIEALARGTPIATTTVGSQGISNSERLLFVGDSEVELAEAIILAMTDRAEAIRRAMAGIDFIERQYSQTALRALFSNLLPKSE